MNINIALQILDAHCNDTKFLFWYRRLIERRVLTPIETGEKHHVLPRCLGGPNDGNIIMLTCREHFIAHALLARAFPNESKLVYAFWAMCNQSNQYQHRIRPCASIYEIAKHARAKHISKLLKGRVFSVETRKRMSESAKNRQKQSPACMKGRKVSTETRMKISQLAKERKRLKCDHCSVECQPSNFHRWHGDNCKKKPNSL